MSSLSQLRFLFVFALIFISGAVANPIEFQSWDAFPLSPSDDDGHEPSNPGATNKWAQISENIESRPAKPMDGSSPDNCLVERTKNLGKRQARPEMCRNNYQMDRKAGQTTVKNDPAVRTPVETSNVLFSNPQKPSTDEEKVCAKAPQLASHPVCATIESVVQSPAGDFFDLDFCRPCEFSFLNIDNSKRNGSRIKARKPTWSKSNFWGGGGGLDYNWGAYELINLGSKMQTSSTHPAPLLNISGAAHKCFLK